MSSHRLLSLGMQAIQRWNVDKEAEPVHVRGGGSETAGVVCAAAADTPGSMQTLPQVRKGFYARQPGSPDDH